MLPSELTELCRLCLIKDQVDVDIFENDSKDIYYRISTCLPVTITIEDKLPKKICLTCVNKINMFYDFWNQTLNAEKHLLSWLEPASLNSDCKSSQPYSYSCISEGSDTNINNHSTGVSSDENNAESDLENNLDKRRTNTRSKDSNKPKSNQILNVDYQDEKPGPSGFQVEQTSALKQLQGLGEELIYLYVQSEAQDSAENQLVSPSIEKYYQNTSNRLNLLFDNDLDRNSVIEIEESNNPDVISKSNIEQTSTYSVEFPKNDRFADVELKFASKKRTKSNDAKGSILYSCEICDVSFSDKTDYHKHELVHYVDYPYECASCGDRFKRFKQLENHKLYHHAPDSSDENDSSPTTAFEIEENDRYRDDTPEKQSRKKSCGGEPRSKVIQHLSHDLQSTTKSSKKNYQKHVEKIDRKIQLLRHNKEDILVCEACGQTFSSSRIHKCLKPKTTSM